jgi:hypothetical protein
MDVLVISRLINSLEPGAVKKINTMKAPFKQVKHLFFSLSFSFVYFNSIPYLVAFCRNGRVVSFVNRVVSFRWPVTHNNFPPLIMRPYKTADPMYTRPSVMDC